MFGHLCFWAVTDDELAFKALADPTRRLLLDRLFERDGRTLTELESGFEMTRFGVMKHLRQLEDAGLVITRRSGREKLHFLNPVPIRLIHDRWIDKYTERQVSALADLKAELEEQDMTASTETATTTQVYRVYIKASPQAIWDALNVAAGDFLMRQPGSCQGLHGCSTSARSATLFPDSRITL